VNVLLVERRAVPVGLVRVAESFAVVADEHDERFVVEPPLAKREEETAELPIGLVEHVEVAAEIVVVGRVLVAEDVDRRLESAFRGRTRGCRASEIDHDVAFRPL
jgi:hypothetical protein